LTVSAQYAGVVGDTSVPFLSGMTTGALAPGGTLEPGEQSGGGGGSGFAAWPPV